MIYDFGLAWRNIRTRPIQTIIPAIVIGLAIALTITVVMLSDATKEGIIKASDPFGVLVIGPKGSSQQLVINTILLQDNPVGLLDYEIYEELANDERVNLAVPLAFGDNVGGARIIGTNHTLFELRPTQNEPPSFRIAEGRLFTDVPIEPHDEHDGAEHEDEEHETTDADHESEADNELELNETIVGGLHDGHDHDENLFEAVLGSRAADELGLEIGDNFQAIHGTGPGIASDVHDEVYTVVGILEPSQTAYDSAVFTQIQSVWEIHHVHEDDPLAPFLAEQQGSADSVTAILVSAKSYADNATIWQDYYSGTEAQVAFPGQELVELFNDIDQAQEILTIVAYLVLGIAALTVFLAMYNATVARERAIAIMRGLGSSRLTVFRVVLFETFLVTLIGAVAGRLIGYPTVIAVADYIAESSAIPMPLRILPGWEALLWVLPLGVGAVAGLLPAVMAYRVNVVEKLFPS